VNLADTLKIEVFDYDKPGMVGDALSLHNHFISAWDPCHHYKQSPSFAVLPQQFATSSRPTSLGEMSVQLQSLAAMTQQRINQAAFPLAVRGTGSLREV
jgi:hypothetical protein